MDIYFLHGEDHLCLIYGSQFIEDQLRKFCFCLGMIFKVFTSISGYENIGNFGKSSWNGGGNVEQFKVMQLVIFTPC